MFIGRSTLPSAPRKPLLFLGIAAFLTACTGGTGDMLTSTAAPAFTSTPQTSAVQDTTYTYQFSTQAAAGAVNFSLLSAPSGAALNGNTITWTPTAAQSRVPNQFSVRATNAAGTATQSWTVTPNGTITGSWIETYWTSTGPVQVRFNLAPGLPPTALAPQPDGSFQIVQGSGNADGTFSIPNVPPGYYWFAPTPAAMYWTSSSSIDLGIDLFGDRPPGTTPTSTTTTVDVNLSGLDPLQAGDVVEFLSDPPSFPFAFNASSAAGATGLISGQSIGSNIDFSQIHSGLLLQYEPVDVTGLTALASGAETMISNLSLSNGTTNTITATLNHAPSASFDLNVKGSAWVSLLNSAGPNPATPVSSTISVVAQPSTTGSQSVPFFGGEVPLLLEGQGLPAFLFPSCPGSGPAPSGSLTLPPGGSPITMDQDFGIVQYGDPLPSSWHRIFSFCQTASLSLPLPGSSSPVPFDLTDAQSTSIPASPIAPLISQVQNPTINGSSLFVAASVPATGVTLSWTPPSGTAPTGYKIAALAELTDPLNGSLSYGEAGTFYTATTSVPLPPLQAGKTYIFVITAILDGAANFETSPNRSALPTASVSIICAPITVAGP